jgi:AraC-like DNA-binding protein
MNMIRFFPNAAGSSAPLYATILRDLAAAAMLRAGISERTEQLSLLAVAQRYVAEQAPGTLSVAGMTAALGISRSVLYRLFEREGGPLAYDRRRRLRAVHRAISNPLNKSTLSELSVRYGFHDQSNLARSFRNAFGYNPSAARRQYDAQLLPDKGSPADRIRESLNQID